MPEVTIKYKSQKTLEALKDLSKYFDFIISKPRDKGVKSKDKLVINGVTMIRGLGATSKIDDAEMSELFTRNNFDAKELRTKAWQRKK